MAIQYSRHDSAKNMPVTFKLLYAFQKWRIIASSSNQKFKKIVNGNSGEQLGVGCESNSSLHAALGPIGHGLAHVTKCSLLWDCHQFCQVKWDLGQSAKGGGGTRGPPGRGLIHKDRLRLKYKYFNKNVKLSCVAAHIQIVTYLCDFLPNWHITFIETTAT